MTGTGCAGTGSSVQRVLGQCAAAGWHVCSFAAAASAGQPAPAAGTGQAEQHVSDWLSILRFILHCIQNQARGSTVEFTALLDLDCARRPLLTGLRQGAAL